MPKRFVVCQRPTRTRNVLESAKDAGHYLNNYKKGVCSDEYL